MIPTKEQAWDLLCLTTEVRMLRGHKDRKFLCTSFRVE